MSGVAAYGSLLRLEHAKRMTLSGFFARLPISMNALGILLLVHHTAGDYTSAGISSGAYVFASSLSAPYKGRLVDRHGVVRGVLPLSMAHAASLLTIVVIAELGLPIVTVVAASALAGITLPTLMPIARAIWGQMVEPAGLSLQSAYALEGSIQESIFVFGPLGVGIAYAFWAGAGLLVAAALTLFGTLAYCRTTPVRAWRPAQARGEGHPLRARGFVGLLAVAFLACCGYGILEVLLPAIGKTEGLGRLVGLLLAMVAVGSALGALTLGLRPAPRVPARALAITMPIIVVAALPLAWASGTPALMVAAFVCGAPLGGFFIFVFMVCVEVAFPGTEVESQTWLTMAMAGGIAVGTVLGGLLADHTSQRDAIFTSVAFLLVGTLVALGWQGRPMRTT